MSDSNARQPAGGPTTSAQVRSAVSRSHEPGNVHGSEIAAAPLGTDDEAGTDGAAPAAVRDHAEAMIGKHAPEVAAAAPRPATRGE